ncbi:conjugation TrbI-like protein [Klebsiella pneumoniae]|nr:conjugation TrbI-like protein [Klebsiella pneumoniae]
MTPSSPVEGVATITGVKRINLDPNLYIPADRYIPCSMMRRFVSDVAGRISCMIGQDVYSANNFVKLIPAGTIARGFYKTGTLNHGQGRMFIAWAELRTPDKLQIPLADADVVGQLGEAGVEGWIDTHFSERFLGSMMVGMIPDVAAWAADQSGSKDRNTDYTENSRQAFADIAKSAFDNSVNIPPTMYLNQGDVIGIMTATDIDFSDVYKLRMH